MTDFRKLDRVIHERGRLAIMSLLAGGGTLTFTELKARLEMTDGNLSRHLATLQDHGLVHTERLVGVGRPQTEVRLTEDGVRALRRYIERLEAILEPARASGTVVDDEEVPEPA
jgi:DNA-binding transcriptional ArsR family regulator